MIKKILVVFSAIVILLATEFFVNCMLFLFFSSMYPLQKYKTIRRKFRSKKARDRVHLTYLFQYGMNFKTVFIFALCWIHRISGLITAFWICFRFFASIPFSFVPYGEAVYWFWRGVQLIVAIICLLKLRNRTL